MEYALVIKQERWWGLVSMHLYQVEEDDSFYRIIDEVDTVPESQELGGLCSRTQLMDIYKRQGTRAFRSYTDFYERGDKAVQDFVRQINDRTVCAAVRAAADAGCHIFRDIRHNGVLYFKDELHYVPDPVKVTMKFLKNNEGIEYRLLLNGGGIPCRENPVIICLLPSLFIWGSRICSFQEGQSGKLLQPFLTKEHIFIPARMQEEYFRKFILKSAFSAEIEADGFAFDDIGPEMEVSVCMQRNVFGKYSLCLSFKYGEEVFDEGSPKKKVVRLKEDGQEVGFVRTCRSSEKEDVIIRKLRTESGMPSEGTLEELIDWLGKNKDMLSDMKVTHQQLTERQYYIGNVSVSSDRNVVSDWFQLRVILRFEDGTQIPLMALKNAILNGEREFLLPNGLWFLIPENWFARYAPLMLFGVKSTDDTVRYHKSQSYIGETVEETPVSGPADGACTDEKLPDGLNAELRPYQAEGYRWILGHLRGGSGCCLSDDMGLGKTIQAISVILKYVTSASQSFLGMDDEPELFSGAELTPYLKSDPVLVVSPASVVFNWKNELRRFAPSLSVLEYTGTSAQRSKSRKLITKADVTLTTYQTLRNDIGHLSRICFGMVVFDESQQFKNDSSVLYSAVKMLKSPFRLALSGTPMENNLSELWSLMSVLVPELLGQYAVFRDNFMSPINSNLLSEKTDILRNLISPFFLKRRKEDVLDSLPSRQDETILCDMTPEQKSMYEKELSSMRNMLLDDSARKDTMHILAAITRLRQIASFPMVLDSSITSGKMEAVFEKLEQLYGTSHKALIFSEYVSFLDVVASEMTGRGWDYVMLTGKSSDRESTVDRFMNDEECSFFLISLKAGGVGLNLTRADYVFILDPWWNRSAEEQAACRAYRIGQDNPVVVYRFITEDTLEEQIVELQDRKSSLIEAVMSVV